MASSTLSDRIYPRLPIPLQHAACTLYGWREGRVRSGRLYRGHLERLLETDHADAATISSRQDEDIHAVVRHAWESVPYYQRVFAEYGVHPQDITSRAHLAKLPILTRKDLIENYDALFSTHPDHRQVIPRATSGTTGTALRFASTPNSIAFQRAVWARHIMRFGVDPAGWHVNFTGKAAVPIGQAKPPFWRFNFAARQVIIPMNQIVPVKIRDILGVLNAYSYAYYTGYPSILSSLAQHMNDLGLELERPPGGIFVGAEKVLEFQRISMEKAFKAPVTDQYGFSEGCGSAAKCEHQAYHEDWELGALECLGAPPLEGGARRGRVVATGFTNYAFPLIRYEVGDEAEWAAPDRRCPCGRHSTVLAHIEGRTEDYVVTPEGGRFMRFDYLFKGTPEIREAQVVQNEVESIVIRYVAQGALSARRRQEIEDIVRAMISLKLKVYYERVETIERTRSGKFRAVVSHLPKFASGAHT